MRLSIFLITLALIAGMIGCDGDGGYNPPPTQNLEIRTWYDLDAVRGNLTGSYVLMNNLDSATPGYDGCAAAERQSGEGLGAYRVGILGFDVVWRKKRSRKS